MNMLALKGSQLDLEFLDKATYSTLDELTDLVTDIFEMSYETMEEYSDTGGVHPIPTVHSILLSALDFFDYQYLDFIKNGHGGPFGASIRKSLKGSFRRTRSGCSTAGIRTGGLCAVIPETGW